MRRRPAAACAVDDLVPGCDTGPGGRLAFVLREARAAWRTRRASATDPNDSPTDSAHLPDDGTR